LLILVIYIGFDNPGKSLFTSIRELVENSLDAAETARV
jgi:DNA topoisomerase VI subunit B